LISFSISESLLIQKYLFGSENGMPPFKTARRSRGIQEPNRHYTDKIISQRTSNFNSNLRHSQKKITANRNFNGGKKVKPKDAEAP